MVDQFTEVTSQSWFSRIGGAIKGLFIGLILFIVAFPLLFWNEGRAVERYKTLVEGSGLVVSVSADTVEPNNDGKLIHVMGRADTTDTLNDPEFGISVSALKLKRNVEMYQWKESSDSKTEKKLGGGTETVTTYDYEKGWSRNVVDSNSFKDPAGHKNPGQMPYTSSQQTAADITLGAYKLSTSLAGKISNFQTLPLTNDLQLSESLQGDASVANSQIYMGESASDPQIGDLRIGFQISPPADVSVVSRQVSNSFEAYRAEAGGTIELLEMGMNSAEAMFQEAQSDNTILTWILRVAGFAVMFIGLNMFFKPLSVLADVLPFLGTLVGMGTGLIAFLLASVLSLITIAIAWIYYRPLLGIALLVVAVAITFVIRSISKSAKIKNAAAAA